MGVESKAKCNWCEYIGSYSCCELDKDGKIPEYDQDFLEIRLTTVRVDCSTPQSAPAAGVKVLTLDFSRRDRKTGQSLIRNHLMLHAYTPAYDPAAEVVVSRLVRNDFFSQGAAEQVKSWIHECESQQCGKDGGFYKDKFLPTRVIDIGLESSRNPRMVETHGSKGVYATLSYCWGRQKGTTLRRDNISQLQTEIDVKNLLQTIQDAIAVTRQMSIPYVWVDALCNVQDDEVEKAKEIARMQDIYSCSAVTIIASSASSAHEGFLSLPGYTYSINSNREPVVIPVRLAHDKFGTMSLVYLNGGICYEESREQIARKA
jgi:heterokaryon incompatibility protein (HET)